MDGAGCGGKGRILGREGGHGLSGLVAQRLRTRDRGCVRLQRDQVSHLELERTAGAAAHQEDGAAQNEDQVKPKRLFAKD